MPLVLGIVVLLLVGGYFYLNGAPGTGSHTVNTSGITGQLQQLSQHHWFYPAVAALICTAFLITFWRRIGGFGRATFIAVGAVVFCVTLLGAHL